MDNAILLCGVLTCGRFFHHAEEIGKLDLAISGLQPRGIGRGFPEDTSLLPHGWMPEVGFLPYRWMRLQRIEADDVYLLGLGSFVSLLAGGNMENAWKRVTSRIR